MRIYSLEKLNTLSLLQQSISAKRGLKPRMGAIPEAQCSKPYPWKHLEGSMNRVSPTQCGPLPLLLPRPGSCKAHLSLN